MRATQKPSPRLPVPASPHQANGMPGLPTGGLGAMMGIGLGTELLMQPAPFARDMLEGQ